MAIEIVVDRYGDRWVKRQRRDVFKNVDQDDVDQTLGQLMEIAGPVVDYKTGDTLVPCPLTHSHTSTWCGNPTCRES